MMMQRLLEHCANPLKGQTSEKENDQNTRTRKFLKVTENQEDTIDCSKLAVGPGPLA